MDRERITKADLDQVWLDGGLPDSQRPKIAMVRYVTLREWPDVIAECMTAEGVPTTSDGEGIVNKNISVGSEATLAMAQYVCQARYPTEPEMLAPLNEGQIRYLYSYYTGAFRKCLQAHGFDIPEPPSEQVYVESYYRGAWDPTSNVPSSNFDIVGYRGECPQTPMELFGGR